MKPATLWLLVVAALVVFGGGGVVVYNATRGLRNNNPGNIRKTATDWRGEVVGSDSAFETFATPEAGIRALAVLLRNYQRKYGLRTVRAIITRYAPPSENNTESYVSAVARRLNVGADQAINLEDAVTLSALVQAVIKHEYGVQPGAGAGGDGAGAAA